MHDLISAHLKKGAEHHEEIGERHASLRSIHQERAKHLEHSAGDLIGARHHKLFAEHHAELAQAHSAYGKLCAKTAKELDMRIRDDTDAGTKVFVGDGPDLTKLFALD